ncbi:hypothetical protein [Flexivirga oryzae]|uniref:Uncharacterized protein n=1 Tax=Flexivirga oryzae TaxID=1794944 RepID=A0A839N9Q7_9MICO|nr:hypothetical protein [Flexivirga oryzae]MBB2893957.1 hypothetical protein [Flexivirga oryzae]
MASVDDQLFGQTYQQILSSVLGGEKENFQLIYPYLDWWWPTAPSGQIAAPALSLLNSVPQWSAVGQFDPSGATLLNCYQQTLQHVNPTIPPDQQQAVTNAHNLLVAAQNQYQNDLTARNQAWAQAKSSNPPDAPALVFADWALQSGWTGTLAEDTKATAVAQRNYAQAFGQQSPELTQALAAATQPANVTPITAGWTAVNQGDGTLVPAPAFSMSTSSGQDWVNLLSQGGGNQVTIKVGQGQGSYDFSKSWAGGNASYDAFFWGVDADGSWEKWDLDESDASVSATISLTATKVLTAPGAWYNGGYLKTLAGGGSFYSPWTSTGGSSPIFGEGGLLPLQVVGLVAGYQPSYEITMSANTYTQHYQKYEASAGIRIGPFRFGGSGGHESNTIERADSTTSFKGKSTATYPFLMGIITAQPGIS